MVNLIYGGSNGYIYRYTIFEDEEGDEILMQYIDDDNKNIKKIEVAQNLQFYAVFCDKGSKIYISDLMVAQKIHKILDYG